MSSTIQAERRVGDVRPPFDLGPERPGQRRQSQMTNQTNNSTTQLSPRKDYTASNTRCSAKMSAIIIHSAPHATETSRLLPRERANSSSITVSNHSRTGTSSTQKQIARVAPLKESLSTGRFVLICIGIWSSNFVFAFQSTAIPTLAVGVSSGFGHAELAAYLGSVFSLASAAGKSYSTRNRSNGHSGGGGGGPDEAEEAEEA